jgi:FMN phosphatase YigB (HAD superfamily)
MSLILLIDLDDTLISNSMDTFIPAYLHALGSNLAEFGDPESIISKLLSATDIMMKNDSPDITLKEKFDQNYYPQIGVEYDEIQPAINDFYSNHFPSLQKHTESRNEAIELVQRAFERGYKVVIATNPLFPITAIHQRLNWGNLSPDSFDFSVITSYENFHFAKPNPAYFAEILAQIGWSDLPVIMIGNDKQADIDPAREFGLATFWVHKEEDSTDNHSSNHPPSGIGWLNGILDWIDAQPIESLRPQFDSPTAITAILKSTPAALSTITQWINPETWNTSMNQEEWSSTEIICHLRDVDQEIYIPRIKTILSANNSFIEAVDADKWAEERRYREQDGASALQEFIQHRLKLLEILASVKQKEWKKEARHTIFGPTSLKELFRISARHDRLHIQQLFQTLQSVRE